MHNPLQIPCFMAAGECTATYMCSCSTILKPESLRTRGQSELKDNPVGCRLDLRQKGCIMLYCYMICLLNFIDIIVCIYI